MCSLLGKSLIHSAHVNSLNLTCVKWADCVMYYNKIVIVDCTFQGILTADTDNKSLVVSLKLYQKYPLYVKYFHYL